MDPFDVTIEALDEATLEQLFGMALSELQAERAANPGMEPYTMEDGTVLYVAKGAGLNHDQATALFEHMTADCPLCAEERAQKQRHKRKPPW